MAQSWAFNSTSKLLGTHASPKISVDRKSVATFIESGEIIVRVLNAQVS